MIKDTATLRRRILNGSARVGIVGQGYVGLSLACAAADAGFETVGIDVDAARIDDLLNGRQTIPGVPTTVFDPAFETGRMHFTTDFGSLAECEIQIVCVPTPLKDGTPDLSFVINAVERVTNHLGKGRLVILESTTYPGTTDEVVRPLLESNGLSATHDFLLAYSPERIDPGNTEYDFRSIARVVGGLTPEATGVATLFYSALTDKVFAVSSCRAAELAKLLENTFRHVNIALINEMATMCHELEIDVWEVIAAAASKPFGFMPFTPGAGVGGHCIPLDPTYLSWQIRRDVGKQLRILEQAQDINAQMPSYVAARVGEALNEIGKPIKDTNVFVLGVTYKSDVGDMRESPALKVMTALHKKGAKVSFHDPYIEHAPVNGGVLERVELNHRAMDNADIVVLLAPHSFYDLDWLAERAALIFDTTNAYGDDRRANVVRL